MQWQTSSSDGISINDNHDQLSLFFDEQRNVIFIQDLAIHGKLELEYHRARKLLDLLSFGLRREVNSL